MQSLEWGLATDVETEVTQRLCLQTMAAMAEHAYRTLQAAQGGQGSAESAAALLGPETQNGRALLAFLSGLFNKLLFGAGPPPTPFLPPFPDCPWVASCPKTCAWIKWAFLGVTRLV